MDTSYPFQQSLMYSYFKHCSTRLCLWCWWTTTQTCWEATQTKQGAPRLLSRTFISLMLLYIVKGPGNSNNTSPDMPNKKARFVHCSAFRPVHYILHSFIAPLIQHRMLLHQNRSRLLKTVLHLFNLFQSIPHLRPPGYSPHLWKMRPISSHLHYRSEKM